MPAKSAQHYSCPHYAPAAPNAKRCRHYLDGGACGLPDEFMCVEWLRVNEHVAPTPAAPVTAANVPGVAEVPPNRSKPSTLPTARLTPNEIASFKALGVEVRLELAGGECVWLVPRYTDAPRKEITPEHAATLQILLGAFPGARVTAFAPVSQRGSEPA